MLQDFGWQTTGLDPAPNTVTRHRMVEFFPTEERFDVVIMKHVLEHLLDPLSVLRMARLVLPEGGHLFLAMPTIDGLRQHRKKSYCLNRLHHVSGYTRRSLQQVLGIAGFEITKQLSSPVPYRMAFVAKAVAGVVPLQPDPLRDARLAFRGHAIGEEGLLRVLFTSVQHRAAGARSKDRQATRS